MRIKTFILGTGALLSLSIILSPVAIAEEKPVIIAGDKSYPPIEYLEDGIPKGLNVELLQALSKAMGREISIRLMLWNDAQQRVLNGQADALSFMSPSEKREKLYDFSYPTLPSKFSIFVQSDELTIHNVSDLEGKRVGITQGGYPRKVLEPNNKIYLVFIENYFEGFQFLLAGKIDAVAADTWVGAYIIQKHSIKGIKITGEPFVEMAAAIALKKGNVKLLQEINTGIQKLKKDGTIERLIDKWSAEEVVFLTRKRMRQALTFTIVILALIGAVLIWVKVLGKQVTKRTALLQESEERFRVLFEGAPDAIFLADPGSGKILDSNPAASKLLLKPKEEIIGLHQSQLHPPRIEKYSMESFSEHARKKEETRSIENFVLRSDGSETPVEIMAQTVHIKGKPVLQAVFRDITARKIKASLKEKEVLLREIHHRVKNNMQVIISLLRLQSDYAKGKQYKEMLEDSQSRIKSMSLIHEKLYQSEDLAIIDFDGYVKDLANRLFGSHGVSPEQIALNIEVEDVSLGLDNAIPCGLIINELVSNSLKHAFPHDREGEIRIALRSVNEDEVELTVSDDGIGIPEDLDFKNPESLGLELVKILAEYQLDAKIELNRTGGTKFHIQFKRETYRGRV